MRPKEPYEKVLPQHALGTRAERGTSGEDERIYASEVGSLVEPIVISLLDHRTPSVPVSPDFVRAYTAVAREAEETLFARTHMSTEAVLDTYYTLGWMTHQNTQIPPDLATRAVKRLPAHENLSYLLTHIDAYTARFTGNRFLGAYQAHKLTGANTSLHPFGRFLINGLLVTSREVITHASNYAELMSNLSMLDRVSRQDITTGTERLHRNVKFISNQNSSYLFQADAIVTDDEYTLNGYPIEHVGPSGTLPSEILLSNVPWSIVNLKLVGDSRLISGRHHLMTARSSDIKQLFGQLNKIIYTLKFLEKRDHINFPQHAVFVYARPCRGLSIVRQKLDADFYQNYWDYINTLLSTGRVDPALREPLVDVSTIVAVTLVNVFDGELETPTTNDPSDEITDYQQAMADFIASAEQSHLPASSAVGGDSEKWDEVLQNERELYRILRNARKGRKPR